MNQNSQDVCHGLRAESIGIGTQNWCCAAGILKLRFQGSPVTPKHVYENLVVSTSSPPSAPADGLSVLGVNCSGHSAAATAYPGQPEGFSEVCGLVFYPEHASMSCTGVLKAPQHYDETWVVLFKAVVSMEFKR